MGDGFPIGTVRRWQGGLYRKTAEDKWSPVPGGAAPAAHQPGQVDMFRPRPVPAAKGPPLAGRGTQLDLFNDHPRRQIAAEDKAKPDPEVKPRRPEPTGSVAKFASGTTVEAPATVRELSPEEGAHWQRYLGTLTKHLRGLPAESVDAEGISLLRSFDRDLQGWVLDSVLGRREITSSDQRNGEESFAQSRLRRAAWDARHAREDAQITWHGKEDWLKRIERWRRKASETIKQATAIIEDAHERGAPITRHLPERFSKDGVQIEIRGQRREHFQAEVGGLLRAALPEAQSRMREAGLGKVLEGMRLDVNCEGSSLCYAAGTYDTGGDVVTITPSGLTSKPAMQTEILVHELGHRIWHRFLTPELTREWEKGLTDHVAIPSGEDPNVPRAAAYLYKRNAEIEARNPNLRLTQREAILLDEARDDPTLTLEDRVLFDRLAKQAAVSPDYKESLAGYEARLHRALERDPDANVSRGEDKHNWQEWISSYARTNPAEAFCEALAHYVTRGRGP